MCTNFQLWTAVLKRFKKSINETQRCDGLEITWGLCWYVHAVFVESSMGCRRGVREAKTVLQCYGFYIISSQIQYGYAIDFDESDPS